MVNPGFQIDYRHSTGNLHIQLSGAFNGKCAWTLFKIIMQQGRTGRVFISTGGLKEVAADGVELFRSHMGRESVPQDWLYFKGKKGFKIAPDGSRVLICPRRSKSLEDCPRSLLRSVTLMKSMNKA